MKEIEVSRALLPICTHCKKIRDEEGYWNRLEEYFLKHSEIKFTHCLCPECLASFYPELKEENECNNK